MKKTTRLIDTLIGLDRFLYYLNKAKFFLPNVRIPQPSATYMNYKISKQIAKVFKNNLHMGSNQKKIKQNKILFLDPRGGEYVRIILGVLAKRLEHEGYQSQFINCQTLPICNDTSIITNRPANICENCLKYSNSLMDAFNLPYKSLNQLIDNGIREFAAEEVKTLSRDEVLNYTFRGFPLGSFLKISVASYLFRGDVPKDDASLKIIHDFLTGLIILFHAYEKLLDIYNPDFVITVNGRFFWHKLAYEISKSRGLKVITIDDFGSFGGTGNRWMFSHDVPIAELNLNSYWKNWEHVPLSKNEDEYLEKNFILGSMTNKVYHKNPLNDWDAILKIIGFENASNFDVMFTNLTWDSTAIEKDLFFANMFDWIFSTIDAYIQNKKNLLIRIHPAEEGIFGYPSLQKVKDSILNKYGTLPENIRIVASNNNVSSYQLLEKANLRIVYSSTIGLEGAVRGIPVVVAGDVHYGNKGFTIDPNSKSEYFDIINDSGDIKDLDSGQIQLAKQYAFFYLYRTKIPLDFYDAQMFQINKVKLHSYKDILPGANPYLDLVIEGIMRDKPIVLSRELTNKLFKL